MTLLVNSYGDNPQMPSITAGLYIPDQLIAGNLKLVTQPILVSGNAPVPRGTVLGEVTDFGAYATAGTANVGNGSVTASAVTGATLLGAYTLTAASSTVFDVVDPDGTALANATVGTAYTAEGLTFLITAGVTAFAVGDSFTITVVDAIGTFIVSVKTASDGSQNPSAVSVDYVSPTTGAPVRSGAYVMGEFNVNVMNYDSSWTPATLATAMRPFGLFVKNAVSAVPSGTSVSNPL